MKLKVLRWCSLLMCALLLGWGTQVWADGEEEPVSDDPVVEEPAEVPEYQNAAQAAHDANLAEAYLEKVDAEAAAIQSRLDELDPNDPANENEIARLTAELDDLAAAKTGIEEGAIAKMRADGMGWGEIAHELGIHPGVLGLGHSKKSTVMAGDDLALATTTDMQTGNSMGHGNAYKKAGMDKAGSANNGNKGDKDKGSHGNSGKGGNDKGGNGNNGNGNGGGKK